MAAIAHSPEFAKKAGVPVKVGKEFMKADKGRKFREGGEMKESKAMIKKEVEFMKKKGAPSKMIKHEEKEMKEYSKGGKTKKMAMGGMPVPPAKGTAAALNAMKKRIAPGNAAPRRPVAAPSMPGVPAPTMKKGGSVCKEEAKKEVKAHEKRLHGMAKGGVAKTVTKEMEYDYKTGKKSFAGTTAQRDAHAEKEGKRVAKDLAYDKAKGFCRGGGIESRGKTKGTMVKMASGGMAKKKYC